MQSQQIATVAWSRYGRKIIMLALELDYNIKEEACMKYLNATSILPDTLVKSCRTMFRVVTSTFQ